MFLNSTVIDFSKWLTISRVIASVGFYSTLVSVAIFLVLTVFYVRTNYDNYKRYMIVFSLLGFCLAAIEAAVNPVFHSYNAGFVMFSLAHPFNASTEFAFTLLCEFIFVNVEKRNSS
uniref:Serpentine receptor class gamma n=1 Tax=Caenorhabditis tropicalis TaxID=1561998 RepID=A0A1I7U857_9PELO